MTKEVERLFKAKLVDALRAFDGFCDENGLDYYALALISGLKSWHLGTGEEIVAVLNEQ